MTDRAVSVLRNDEDRLIPVAGVYEIDDAHTAVEFVGRHLMITKVRGRFSDVRAASPSRMSPRTRTSRSRSERPA